MSDIAATYILHLRYSPMWHTGLYTYCSDGSPAWDISSIHILNSRWFFGRHDVIHTLHLQHKSAILTGLQTYWNYGKIFRDAFPYIHEGSPIILQHDTHFHHTHKVTYNTPARRALSYTQGQLQYAWKTHTSIHIRSLIILLQGAHFHTHKVTYNTLAKYTLPHTQGH